jgi:zinc transporter, ZIP family
MMTSALFGPEVLTALIVSAGAAFATVLGALSIVWSDKPHPRLLSFGLAFAGGAMVYVSLAEIFVKSQNAFTEVFDARLGYTYATLAFFTGIIFLMTLDRLVPNPHMALAAKGEDERKQISRMALMAALAITAHNFPEGLATFFATLDNPVVGAPLAFAIAVHNIPEGISIAIPVYYATGSKGKAVIATCFSALAEPMGALLGYFVLAPYLSPAVYGAVFGVIAGVMVFLALDELLPTAKRYGKGHETVYGIVLGMAVMALSLVLFK